MKEIKTTGIIDLLEKTGIVKIELGKDGLAISSIHHQCDCKQREVDVICIESKTHFFSKEDVGKFINELQVIMMETPTDVELLS